MSSARPPAPAEVCATVAEPAIDPRVTAAASGDRAAAQELLTELMPRVRNLVRYLVRGDREVDDIAQEALIAIARGFASFRGEGALSAWADRITARVTFAHLRRARRDPAQVTSVAADLAAVPHPGAGPDQYASRRELVGLLDEVSDEQRHALVLHHALGLSVPEIAASLEISPETVRSRLRLGKAKLRALRQQQRDDDEARAAHRDASADDAEGIVRTATRRELRP
ncbi:RNA polymerase sigma factor [Haliangium ochraceum]|uniref:RNA polymerase, sigma-24 subunit, ECF subfamily n=1 Tax=Haliangium ochraceum (strain DSM 14365 / JCM 11303 / SMP-2) TaxID=502025 RepID=D0LTX2_HALO1|nr:sigma-70 family RNA polymerase sigma factor [Haliangium ochraceum]ACY15816.1 RNA polymerase, sigma-24 subunit, ECF subfamily [Haliangium ochraceum DSM 14365]